MRRRMNGNYDDIINLEHPTPKRHPRMKRSDRAAQFSPFAALTGYEDAVTEAARTTEKRIELSEEEKIILNEKLVFIMENKNASPIVTIRYFVPDKLKDGGEYLTVTDSISDIDGYRRLVKMLGGMEIPIDEITEIDGVLFG
ncbi:MAG: YolD-like family protein [Ruminococcaceae bacterium]|nr:YolD-like family protein [Oscillospiraceae bacterium]